MLALIALLGTFALQPACGPKGGAVNSGAEGAEADYGNPKQNFRKGVDLLTAGQESGRTDYDKAYTYFYNATMAKPDFAKAQYNAGWVAEKLGKPIEAIGHYRAALDTAGDYEAAALNLGLALTTAGRTDEAVAIFEAYLGVNPKATDVRNNLIQTLVAAGQTDAAIAQARQILAYDKDNVDVYNGLSRLYFNQGKYDMSLLCSDKARTLNDGDPGIYVNMGVTYLAKGDQPAAIKEFKTALKLAPAQPEANLNLGWLAANSGDYQLAHGAFTIVVEAQPGNVDALLGLAIAQRGHDADGDGDKDVKQAAKTYDRIIDIDAKNEAAYFNAATLHQHNTQDFKRALKYLDTFVKVNEGALSPTHEVFERRTSVLASQQQDEDRKAEEARLVKEAEERKQRQIAQLKELQSRANVLASSIESMRNCEFAMETGMIDQGDMVVEQAMMVVEANEYSMAIDMLMFMDQLDVYMPENIDGCKNEAALNGGSAAGGDADDGGESAAADGGEQAPPAPPTEGDETAPDSFSE
jgi:tetratricopeptide (TPR) repeat protein